MSQLPLASERPRVKLGLIVSPASDEETADRELRDRVQHFAGQLGAVLEVSRRKRASRAVL
jgi:hypothetical protein